MLADELVIGMRVRYPGTGTTGNVVRIENEQGNVFAELDSTHLLYRIDHWSRWNHPVKRNTKSGKKTLKRPWRRRGSSLQARNSRKPLKTSIRAVKAGDSLPRG